MTTNNFNSEVSNANLNSPQFYLDDDGTLKFISPYLASSNFDGSIPYVELTASAQNIKPGWMIQVASAQFVPVISIAYDDLDFTASPSNIITIKYLDTDSELRSKQYDFYELIYARYEDWNNKSLGEQGWTITYGGNAIFANVGVRGDLEATTLDVGGADGIVYDGNTVTIGASVIINAPLTVGASGNFIVSGSAAQDIISNNTTITGGNIATGRIKSAGYSGPGTGSAFSTTGMSINLDDGSIVAPNFKIDNSGNADFKGVVQSASGVIGGFSVSASQISIAGFTMSTASGIFLGNNEQFRVDTAGNLRANSASIVGDIRAQSGHFSGSVSAAQIYGASVTSGLITSGSFIGGILQSPTYSGVFDGSTFSTTGTHINLNTGTITAKQFRINTSGDAFFGGSLSSGISITAPSISAGTISGPTGTIGGFTLGANSFTAGTSPNVVGMLTGGTNAFFAGATNTAGAAAKFLVTNSGVLTAVNANLSGVVTASGGVFGATANPINLISQGTNSVLDMGTIKMVANVTSGNRYGTLRFFEVNGTTAVGELSTTATNKTWFSSVGSQNGLVLGTTSDFLYVPTSSPSKKGRYQGNGFEILSADGTTNLLTVNGGTGTVTIGSSTNNKETTVNGKLTVAGGNLLENTNGDFRCFWSATSFVPFRINNGATGAATITSGAIQGFLAGTGTTLVIDASDRIRKLGSTLREKKNIETYNPNIQTILDMRPVLFHYNSQEDSESKLAGFIAEEIELLGLKEFVVYNSQNTPEALNYGNMVAALIPVIKSQQQQINSLEEKLYNIQQRLEAAGI